MRGGRFSRRRAAVKMRLFHESAAARQRNFGVTGSAAHGEDPVMRCRVELGRRMVSDFNLCQFAHNGNQRTGESAEEVGATDAIFR